MVWAGHTTAPAKEIWEVDVYNCRCHVVLANSRRINVKNKHLYSLLDQSYTTIAVVFLNQNPIAAAPPQPAKRAPGDTRIDRNAAPWGQAESTAIPEHYGACQYTYKAPRIANISVDDYVVVHSKARGLVIARVVRVDDNPRIDVDASFDYKWIVQRVDREGYDQRVRAEQCFADAMLDIERVRQRELMLSGFRDTLPEGTEARALFDRTVQSLNAPTIDPAPKAG